MEEMPNSGPSPFQRRITDGATELIESGYRGMPLAEAARRITRTDEDSRQQILAARAESGDTSVLDPVLFPEKVFNADGTRKTNNEGRPLLTDDEWGAYFEVQDARHSFN
jgi:hypothetical protein